MAQIDVLREQLVALNELRQAGVSARQVAEQIILRSGIIEEMAAQDKVKQLARQLTAHARLLNQTLEHANSGTMTLLEIVIELENDSIQLKESTRWKDTAEEISVLAQSLRALLF